MIAQDGKCMHNASMPNVLIRDVPIDVHDQLQKRAKSAGKSLQQFLAAELVRVANAMPMSEVLDRIAHDKGGHVGFASAVDGLHLDRDHR